MKIRRQFLQHTVAAGPGMMLLPSPDCSFNKVQINFNTIHQNQ